jgi:flagella basal body P-ring formation protein FlgA
MMNRCTALVFFALLLSAPAWSEGCLTVDNDRVYAADLARARPIFEALDPGLFIGYAPAPGLERVFTAGQLARLLQRHGIAGSTGGRLCVERETVLLTEEVVIAALRAALDSDVQMELVDFSNRPVPRGDLAFKRNGLAIPPSATPQTPALWRGKIVYGDRRSVPVWARVRLSKQTQQVVAVRDLRAGEALGATDLMVETAEIFPREESALDRIEDAVGASLRRSVQSGDPIYASLLRLPNDVDRGQVVSIEVASGSAVLRFDARAETAGRQGDRILVENPITRKRFSATVTGRGTAMVDASPRS